MNIQILLWLFNSNSEINRLSSLKYIRFRGCYPIRDKQPDFRPGWAAVSLAVMISRTLAGSSVPFVSSTVPERAVWHHSHSVREPVQ